MMVTFKLCCHIWSIIISIINNNTVIIIVNILKVICIECNLDGVEGDFEVVLPGWANQQKS